MSRKARIAPMMRENIEPIINSTVNSNVSQFADIALTNQNPTAFNESISTIQEESDVDLIEEDQTKRKRKKSAKQSFALIKKGAKQKWQKLRNTYRATKNIQKAYEDINYKLMKEKILHWKNKSFECLLDSKDILPTKRKNKLLRGSVQNKNTSKLLLTYFIKLSKIEEDEDKLVDYEFLEGLFEQGVDINVTDKYGQSVMHEVARAWHVDVARFMLTHGANVNHPDDYGRTPLHVASAVDYGEMVELLMENGSDIESRTYEEEQTALHYAAKNDAVSSLKILLKHGGDMNDVDYKKRTALQLSAELDRSLTAEVLLEEGAPAGVYDDSMMSALVLMIQKMPNVALQALDQFHIKNRANRSQLFYLNFMEPPTCDKYCFAKSPLEVAVENNQHQLLLHPVFLRLIEVKWNRFGKRGAVLYNIINFLLCILWTGLLIFLPTNPTDIYYKNMIELGIFFEVIAIVSVIIWVGAEVREFLISRRKSQTYKKWRVKEIERDLKFAHPKWPDEQAFLERQISDMNCSTSLYIRDKWNYFDWLTYCFMISTIVIAGLNKLYQRKMTNQLVRAVGSVTLVFLWVRMLKYARPYKVLGLFVIMLGHVATDVVKMAFLAIHFFIPYLAAFWVTFGAFNIVGYRIENGEIFYNLFLMNVVGDFPFDDLAAHSQFMARILCGSYIYLGGIICLNLFIALMSDTFQRVYDNAKANAIMQRAATIIEMENDITNSKLLRHSEFIMNNCAPEILYYDDDLTSTDNNDYLKKMTHQIHAKVHAVEEQIQDMVKINNQGGDHSKTRNDSFLGGFLNDRSTLNVNTPYNQSAAVNESDAMVKLQCTVEQLQSEHQRAMMQTRAEIAGLGLMLKELIENQDLLKNKKKKHKHKIIDEQATTSTYSSRSEATTSTYSSRSEATTSVADSLISTTSLSPANLSGNNTKYSVNYSKTMRNIDATYDDQIADIIFQKQLSAFHMKEKKSKSHKRKKKSGRPSSGNLRDKRKIKSGRTSTLEEMSKPSNSLLTNFESPAKVVETTESENITRKNLDDLQMKEKTLDHSLQYMIATTYDTNTSIDQAKPMQQKGDKTNEFKKTEENIIQTKKQNTVEKDGENNTEHLREKENGTKGTTSAEVRTPNKTENNEPFNSMETLENVGEENENVEVTNPSTEYFEGYTFPQNDLVSARWQSIFSNLEIKK